MVTLNTTGEQIVFLNWDVPQGNQLEMKLAAGPPLYHSTETAFPYSAAGVVNITGTTDFVDPTANYYYFYDWQIETEFVCGRSAIEVDFQNSPNKPEAEFTPSATTIPLAVSYTHLTLPTICSV